MKSAQEKRDLDIISLPYMGNFPDPDGFLDLLREGSAFPDDFEPSRKLFSRLSKDRFISNASERLRAYSASLRAFEDQRFVIPLHRIYLPILHAKGIGIQDTSYKYEAELKKIFWQMEGK